MPRKLTWIVGGSAVAAVVLSLGWLAGRAGESEPAAEGESAPTAPARRAAPAAAAGRSAPVPRPDLDEKLRHPDPIVRARVLSRGSADDATVLAMLRDTDVSVAAVAGEQVVRRYRDGAFSTSELAGLYQDTRLDLKPRIAILNGLAEKADPEVAELLGRTLAGGDVEERRAAANLIAFQDHTAAVPRLIAALADEDQWVRSNAGDSLRNIADGEDFGHDAAAWTRWWSAQRR
jgi:hypothetical protein